MLQQFWDFEYLKKMLHFIYCPPAAFTAKLEKHVVQKKIGFLETILLPNAHFQMKFYKEKYFNYFD